MLPQLPVQDHIHGRRDILILNELTQLTLAFLAHGLLQRERVSRRPEYPVHLFGAQIQGLGDLLLAGLPTQFLLQLASHLLDSAQPLPHMHRQTDGAALIRQRSRDGLSNPPCGIGAEPVALPIVELVHGAHQTHVPLLDQVQERQPLPTVVLSDANHQTQVGPDQVLPSQLTIQHLQLRGLLLLLGGIVTPV